MLNTRHTCVLAPMRESLSLAVVAVPWLVEEMPPPDASHEPGPSLLQNCPQPSASAPGPAPIQGTARSDRAGGGGYLTTILAGSHERERQLPWREPQALLKQSGAPSVGLCTLGKVTSP